MVSLTESDTTEVSPFTFRVFFYSKSYASLGGVDQFGCPDQGSKTLLVYTQERDGIFIGETPLVSFGVGGKVDVLECESRTVTRACRSNIGQIPSFLPQLEIVDLVLPILSVYIVQLINVSKRTSRNCRNCSNFSGRELLWARNPVGVFGRRFPALS